MPKIPTQTKVLLGDCLDLVPKLGIKFDLIFADPPFNIGQAYEGYVDRKPQKEFDAFINKFVGVCWQQCRGVLALHGPDGLAVRYVMSEKELRMHRIAWLIWHYRFGQAGEVSQKRAWTNSKAHCLVYGREEYTFNGEDVAVESDRVTVYNDKRIRPDEDGKKKGGTRVPFDVWGIPSDGPYWGRVTGGNKERVKDRPNQLPEVYLARLLKAYTNEGDWILDPFGGTGTTAVVAQALRRNVVTIDSDPQAIKSIHRRLKKGSVRCVD